MVFENITELKAIDELLEKEKDIQDNLEKKLNESRNRTKSLSHTKIMLGGETEDFSKKSIPDLLEILFRKYGGQHVDDAKLLLQSEFGRYAAKQTISGALIRYANKDERFERVGKNKFDLFNKNKEK